MCLSAHSGFSRKGKTGDGRVDLLLYRSVMLFRMVLRTRVQVWYLKVSGAELRSRWEGKKEEGTILLLFFFFSVVGYIQETIEMLQGKLIAFAAFANQSI